MNEKTNWFILTTEYCSAIKRRKNKESYGKTLK
jgi:hypothetical protein